MNLRERIEDRVRDLGHPHPEQMTATELLDILDAHKIRARDQQRKAAADDK